MSSTKIPSPSRSHGARSTPRQRRYRQSRSVSSPSRSITSVKLSTKVQENKDNNKDSFIFSPLPSRKSVLSDNTEIETSMRSKRGSWWKRLDENSKDVLEFIEKREHHKPTNVEELIDAEILSQEKKNFTIDLPESSDGESIRSIILPQRKLFTQKDQAQKVYKNVIDKRENLERLQKSKVNYDNTINVGKKDLFNKGRERSKPAFPAGLLNISLDKTELNKKDKDISKQGQVRNLFGNRAGTKRKNMFAEFIVSDSEDEISDIQTKVFGFAKNPDQQQTRASPSNRFRESSPTSDITDVELDDWKQLPSSTMVDNQFGNLENNTPVKKARLSKMMPALEETNKSKSDKVQTNNQSFKSSDKTLENQLDEEKNQMITENNVQSNNSKISQGSNEIIKVVENCGKVPEVPQSEYTPIDHPMVHHSLRKSKSEENINDGTKVSENISKNNKDNLQKSKEYETGKGNHKPIGDIETEHSPSENNTTNVQEDEENKASKENQEESGDNDISQNISDNNDLNQEDDNNDEDLQEDESSDEDQEKEQECTADGENRDDVDDIEVAQSVSKNIDMDILENEDCIADEGNQEEINDDEIVRNNCKNNKEIRDTIGISSQLEQSNNSKTLEINREELNKMEIDQNVFKNNTDNLEKACANCEEIDKDKSEEKKQDNHMEVQGQEQSDERQKNIFINKEMITDGSKSISYENKDVVDNQDQNKDDEENTTKNNQTRTNSTKDLNKRQRKDKNGSLEEKNKSVIDNQNQNRSVNKDNSQTRANASKGLNKSQRNDKGKNKSLNNQDSVQNYNKTAHNKTEQSVQNRSTIDVTHDTTGRNRQKVELEVKSPEEVRNYIANNVEYISPTGRETSSRKTRSVIKLNELRPSLAPLRESTGISDGTCNSSVERSGWDSHRTTRKTLRQTFGKDFTPRKSLRALVMEKSAKRQTYGFDVTTKIPQACSTRLPENMHDITNDDTVDQQHENEMHLEQSEKIPVTEIEENVNVENNKEKTFSHNASPKEPRHLKVNETQLKLQENDVKSNIHTVDPSNILTEEKQTSDSNKKIDESSKERIEYQNTQQYKINGEERNKFQSMELIESGKEIQAMQDSHNKEVEIDDEEMRDSQRAEIETSEQMQDSQNNPNVESDEEMQDSQNDQNGESNEEIQDSQNGESDEEMQESQNDQIDESVEEMQVDVQENVESEDDRRESQNIEEGETDEERESSQEVAADEESDQEMRYSEDGERQESEEERIDSQNNEVEGIDTQHENEESVEGRRYSSKITLEEESDEENVDSQKSQNVPKHRYFINNSTRDQSSNFTEESNREDTLTRRQNIMDILQRVKQQNQEMSRQAEQAVRNSLKRPPKESLDVFKVPLKPNAGLRRLKPAASKSKPKSVKSTHVGIENLPPEVLEDLKYKPPKRYRPSNASWITKRLYKFLETKLESKYDYKARVRAEKLAETLYEFAKETRRQNVADSYAVDTLKNEMARLGIVSTHFEFYQFFHDFMPREIRIKVVPDIVNKISMPKHGIFSNIIR